MQKLKKKWGQVNPLSGIFLSNVQFDTACLQTLEIKVFICGIIKLLQPTHSFVLYIMEH